MANLRATALIAFLLPLVCDKRLYKLPNGPLCCHIVWAAILKACVAGLFVNRFW